MTGGRSAQGKTNSRGKHTLPYILSWIDEQAKFARNEAGLSRMLSNLSFPIYHKFQLIMVRMAITRNDKDELCFEVEYLKETT